MSKKYVIEIKPEYEDTTRGIMVLGAKDSNLYMDAIAVEDMEELTSDYINEHFGDLQEEAYQRGLEDGKKVNDKGCEGCKYEGGTAERNPCFSCSNYYQNYWTAKDDKIEVGDEVEHCIQCFVVTAMNDEHVHGFSKDGTHCFASIKNVRKTGRHFDIASILEAMRND